MEKPFPFPATSKWLDKSTSELDSVQEPVTKTVRATESAFDLVTNDIEADAVTSEGAISSQQSSTSDEER